MAATFKGIVKALMEFQAKLVEHKAQIFVRRAGPNYQEGLRWAARRSVAAITCDVHAGYCTVFGVR